jgi:predicted N-acetyltransferase YhbS
MFLENVAVCAATSGQGIGKSLIQFCEAEARRLGFATVHLYTHERMTDNLSIYPRLGYVKSSGAWRMDSMAYSSRNAWDEIWDSACTMLTSIVT